MAVSLPWLAMRLWATVVYSSLAFSYVRERKSLCVRKMGFLPALITATVGQSEINPKKKTMLVLFWVMKVEKLHKKNKGSFSTINKITGWIFNTNVIEDTKLCGEFYLEISGYYFAVESVCHHILIWVLVTNFHQIVLLHPILGEILKKYTHVKR